jgi:2-keto-4-pentenoate hydratase
MPIRAGDVVTTGSCTGLEIIPAGRVRATLEGMGEVSVAV